MLDLAPPPALVAERPSFPRPAIILRPTPEEFLRHGGEAAYKSMLPGTFPAAGLLAGGRSWPGAYFDGSAYLYKSSALTGATDNKLGTVSFWIRPNIADGTEITLAHGKSSAVSGSFRIMRSTTNRISILATAPGSGTLNLYISTTNNITASAGWKHVCASWDMSSTSKRWIYVNGVSDLAAITTYTNGNLDYTNNQWSVGYNILTAVAADMYIADFMFWPGTYTDLSVAATLAAFYKSGPVDPATTITAVGVTPHMQFSGPWSAWKTNKGSGGAFTETGGTLAKAAFNY